VVALLIFGRSYVAQLAFILLGATLMSAFGVWDDKWGMRPIVKLLGQVLAASILVVSDVQVGFLHNFVPWKAVIPYLNVDLVNWAGTVIWVVVITNALNLMDNMDGLAGGVAAVAAVFFFLIATLTGQTLVATMAAVLVGACIGFLYYNFNPASIFMGDSGSLFLGFMLAATGIKLKFLANSDIVTWMVPVLVLGVPLFDTTLVTISRIRRGIPISRGGKDHFSHRLVALGYTRREAVLILYLIQGALGVAALVVMQASLFEGYMVGLFVLVFAIVAAYRLEQLDLSQANPAPPGETVRPHPVYRFTRRGAQGQGPITKEQEQETVGTTK
jgi:UDP-GlcNAc:undecaprenyl-phosphate GlcNAc-1-phosphate transferase